MCEVGWGFTEVRIGAEVGVGNGAGDIVRWHRGATAAGGSAPASWAAVLDNVWPGELQQGREVVCVSSGGHETA
jgi:hypothetical protein